MIQVENPRFVLEQAEAVKSAAPNFVTNLYFNKDTIESWIRARLLFHEKVGKSDFFFKRDADFFHLSYVSPSWDDLGRGLDELSGWPEILAADVVTKTGGEALVLGVFQGHGFNRYNILVRMCRSGNPGGDEADGSEEVQLASPGDVDRINAVLNERFDRYAEQIPSMDEIAADVSDGKFILMDRNGAIAGLVHFELVGLTSHLRRWFVNPDYRDQHIGSKLLRRYFSLSQKATRFILWVLQSNRNAIERYLHYGYREDDLIDTIFINKEQMQNGK